MKFLVIFMHRNFVPGGTKLFRTSNFIGPYYLEALLFSGLASLLLLFFLIVCQFCEACLWRPNLADLCVFDPRFPYCINESSKAASKPQHLFVSVDVIAKYVHLLLGFYPLNK